MSGERWTEPAKPDCRPEQDSGLIAGQSALVWLIFTIVLLVSPALVWLVWTWAW